MDLYNTTISTALEQLKEKRFTINFNIQQNNFSLKVNVYNYFSL